MNAHDLTFGIEFETTLPSAQADALCPSCGRPPQVTWLPEGWKAMTDCSIQASSGRRGIEFVSPVLQGAADVLDGDGRVIDYLPGTLAKLFEHLGPNGSAVDDDNLSHACHP